MPKVVTVGTICSYPKLTPVPFREDDLWNGYPEETNAPYGLAKKMLLVQSQAYRQQYGCNFVHVLPVNLYGPGDNFDPASSHVIPALDQEGAGRDRRRAPATSRCGARARPRASSSTWRTPPAGIRMAAESYDGAEPVNLGAGFEIQIRDLVKLVVPRDGLPRARSAGTRPSPTASRGGAWTRRARRGCSASARRSGFEDGLRRTIDWYRQQRAPATSR